MHYQNCEKTLFRRVDAPPAIPNDLDAKIYKS